MSAADFSAALQAATAALTAAIANPADGIRLFAQLGAFSPAAATPASVVGVGMATAQTAVGALARRAAIAALARAAAAYQPSSYNDAVGIRNFVTAVIDSEITVAGDDADDATYSALRALRQAVVKDLTARGGDLAPVRAFQFGAPLPSLVVAHRLYQDVSRADQLARQANARHPGFLPAAFTALAR